MAGETPAPPASHARDPRSSDPRPSDPRMLPFSAADEHRALFDDAPGSVAGGTARTRPIRRRRSGWRLRAMSLLLIFLSGVFVARLPAVQAGLGGAPQFSAPIEDVYNAIRFGYVEEKKPEDLQRSAIDGMLEALDDPYAEYIPPDNKDEFEKELTGQYSGIGCEVEIRDSWLTIVSPMEDSPALAAGVMANDRVIKIGETSTFKMPVDECIKLLVGQEGTEVSFTVLRDGKELPFTVKRARIVARSVRGVARQRGEDPRAANGAWDWLIDPERRIAYVRLSQFTPTTASELEDALIEADEAAGTEGLGGIILDLRENPGGALDAAIDICDMFLDQERVLSVRGRGRPEEFVDAPNAGRVTDAPMLVMVDGISASASEIVSGALQDHGRATVLGSRTFGKGLVQTVLPLGRQRNGQVKFTTARYYLPSGRLIQREDESTEWGVDPTPGFYVPETDEQIIDRLKRRRELDVLRRRAAEATQTGPSDAGSPESSLAAPGERWSDPEWVRTEAKDVPLAEAIRAMRVRVDTGKFEPISDAKAQHGQLAVKELRELEKLERITAMELARLDKRARALRKAADTGEAAAVAAVTPDLWSDDAALRDGRIEVRDKEGRVIAVLAITGDDVERWLANADVRVLEKSEADAAGPATSTKSDTPAGTQGDLPVSSGEPASEEPAAPEDGQKSGAAPAREPAPAPEPATEPAPEPAKDPG